MASEEKDETPSVADGVIRHGDQVVLDINFKEKLVIAQVTKNSKVKLHKKYCSLMPVLGHTYGSIFELAPGRNTQTNRLIVIYDHHISVTD